MFKQLWTHFPTLKWTSKANLVMLFLPPLQFFFFAVTYNPFVSLHPHLVFFLNPCLREWFVVLPLLDHWFYTISTLLLKVSFCFKPFSLLLFSPFCFIPLLPLFLASKEGRINCWTLPAHQIIYKITIEEFYVIYYPTISIF
jgi:hypothetical protein